MGSVVRFADIPSGAAVFIDANSIIYHFISEPTYGAASTNSWSVVISVTTAHVLHAAEISQQHGLLTNDAISIAVMQGRELTNLASNDADFDRIAGINRFAPV